MLDIKKKRQKTVYESEKYDKVVDKIVEIEMEMGESSSQKN